MTLYHEHEAFKGLLLDRLNIVLKFFPIKLIGFILLTLLDKAKKWNMLCGSVHTKLCNVWYIKDN